MTNPETTYTGYVIAAYTVAFVLGGGLTMWTIFCSLRARRTWARLEADSMRVAGGAAVVEVPASLGGNT